MIPNQSLIMPSQYAPYLSPDGQTIGDTYDYELGGVGLSDATQGLEVQTWTGRIRGTAASTYITLEAPNTPETTIFSRPNLTWVRIAFDQNMHPVICFVDQSGPAFYWYDPTTHTEVFTALPSTALQPCCTMDDKRSLQTQVGSNDVIIAYISNNNLYFLAQRDRYGTEYLLLSNVQNYIANPRTWKIGMNEKYRLQFYITGELYS